MAAARSNNFFPYSREMRTASFWNKLKRVCKSGGH